VVTASWWLSKKKGDSAWIEPHVDNGVVHLDVIAGKREGQAPKPPKIGRGGAFTCLGCDQIMNEAWTTNEGMKGRIGYRMTAVAVEKNGKRTFRRPVEEELTAAQLVPEVADPPEIALPDNPRWFSGPRFGITTQKSLYMPRQILTLDTFARLVAETHAKVLADGGSRLWADAVTSLLALGVGKMAQYGSTQAMIAPTASSTRYLRAFSRNDVPMTWDFYEQNFFGNAGGTWQQLLLTSLRALSMLPSGADGTVVRADARTMTPPQQGLVATDPPYFDAIGYADLSDYFYVWHRRAIDPNLYATVAVPKIGELTAVPSHHGNSTERARTYFIDGFTETFHNLQQAARNDLPMLVVYASKEQSGGRGEETRWASILTAMIAAELQITATWPVHGTNAARMTTYDSNMVASYVVMACRPRPEDAATSSLADFNRALRRELGPAVRDLQAASILPVDLAQAAMGPGMQIYSRYRAVLDQSGTRVPVDQALRLINAALGEVLDEQEGELDPESRFAVRWWDSNGWNPGTFGEADKAVRPLGISVDDVVRARVAFSQANKVQVLGSGNLDPMWVPSADSRPTAWEAVHHLVHRLIDRGGELEAARLMSVLGNLQDPAMALTYRLHDIAAKRGRTGDQERYNALINSWVELVKLSTDNLTTTEGLF
jgi:putative DNA methylase